MSLEIYLIYPSKIEWDLTNGPLSKLLELLDTQVQGSIQWVLLETSWNLKCFFWEETKKSQVGILPFHERIQFRRRFWTQFSTKDLAATSECVGKEIVTPFRLVVELAFKQNIAT